MCRLLWYDMCVLTDILVCRGSKRDSTFDNILKRPLKFPSEPSTSPECQVITIAYHVQPTFSPVWSLIAPKLGGVNARGYYSNPMLSCYIQLKTLLFLFQFP